MNSRRAVWLHIGLVLSCAAVAPAAVVFVDGRAATCGDGQTWATAYKYLQDALTAVRNSGGSINEIWVAAGTYQPDRSCANPAGSRDRTASFSLVNGVALRGGFAGNEDPATFDLTTRDFETNPTILTGDLAGDDGPNFANNAENTYHIVTAIAESIGTAIDGMTVSGGNANNYSSLYETNGGGVQNWNALTITDCVFVNNWAMGAGGGVYNYEWTPCRADLIRCRFYGNRAGRGGGLYAGSGVTTATDCVFSGNSAPGGMGGGVYAENCQAGTRLNRCTVIGNQAREGGGLRTASSVVLALDHCTLSQNTASEKGGGILFGSNYTASITLRACDITANSAGFSGGGLYAEVGSVDATNCVFAANTAIRGGGLYCAQTNYSRLVNCTLALNGASSGEGGGISSFCARSSLLNCVVAGNSGSQVAQPCGTVSVKYSCVQGGWTGDGNIDADPLFVNPAAGNLRLRAGSPCVDAGSNAAVPAGTVTDILGLPRFWDDPATADCRWAPGTCGAAPIVDMGAHEFAVIRGDLDEDLDVDGDDLTALDACGAGPSVAVAAECLVGDGDGDGDVDGIDFAVLQRCWTGAAVLGDPNCR